MHLHKVSIIMISESVVFNLIFVKLTFSLLANKTNICRCGLINRSIVVVGKSEFIGFLFLNIFILSSRFLPDFGWMVFAK